MNTTFDSRFSPGFQSRCGSPSSIMCTPWKTKRLGSPLNATMPLQRRMFGPRSWVRLVDPRHELVGIEVAVEPRRDRLHVLVVIVLQARAVVVMAIVIVVVIMVVVVVVDGEEFRLDVEDAVEIEGAALEHVGDLDVALLRAMQPRVGVDRADARLDFAQFGRRDEIGLVEDDDVGEGDLVLRLRRVAQPRGAAIWRRRR